MLSTFRRAPSTSRPQPTSSPVICTLRATLFTALILLVLVNILFFTILSPGDLITDVHRTTHGMRTIDVLQQMKESINRQIKESIASYKTVDKPVAITPRISSLNAQVAAERIEQWISSNPRHNTTLSATHPAFSAHKVPSLSHYAETVCDAHFAHGYTRHLSICAVDDGIDRRSPSNCTCRYNTHSTAVTCSIDHVIVTPERVHQIPTLTVLASRGTSLLSPAIFPPSMLTMFTSMQFTRGHALTVKEPVCSKWHTDTYIFVERTDDSVQQFINALYNVYHTMNLFPSIKSASSFTLSSLGKTSSFYPYADPTGAVKRLIDFDSNNNDLPYIVTTDRLRSQAFYDFFPADHVTSLSDLSETSCYRHTLWASPSAQSPLAVPLPLHAVACHDHPLVQTFAHSVITALHTKYNIQAEGGITINTIEGEKWVQIRPKNRDNIQHTPVITIIIDNIITSQQINSLINSIQSALHSIIKYDIFIININNNHNLINHLILLSSITNIFISISSTLSLSLFLAEDTTVIELITNNNNNNIQETSALYDSFPNIIHNNINYYTFNINPLTLLYPNEHILLIISQQLNILPHILKIELELNIIKPIHKHPNIINNFLINYNQQSSLYAPAVVNINIPDTPELADESLEASKLRLEVNEKLEDAYKKLINLDQYAPNELKHSINNSFYYYTQLKNKLNDGYNIQESKTEEMTRKQLQSQLIPVLPYDHNDDYIIKNIQIKLNEYEEKRLIRLQHVEQRKLNKQIQETQSEREEHDDYNFRDRIKKSDPPYINYPTSDPLRRGDRGCIIIPFRDSGNNSQTSQGADRTKNLIEIIPYLYNHLNRSKHYISIDYEIVIIEQTAGLVFNKGALFNSGYDLLQHVCTYFILHDVDQLPSSLYNHYSFPTPVEQAPLHMCTAASQFFYRMAYDSMVGGAIAMTTQAYEEFNGYGNCYWGWGLEDDDFYARISRKVRQPIRRLNGEVGRYEALGHTRVKDLDVTPRFRRGQARARQIGSGQLDLMNDGWRQVKYRLVKEVQLMHGVRKLTVDLMFVRRPNDLN